MSDNFELDLADGYKHTDTVSENVDSMKATLKHITNEVEQIKGAGWDGSAQAAFNATAVAWDEEAQRLQQRLDELAATLGGEVFKGADQTNEEIASDFQNMAGNLNL